MTTPIQAQIEAAKILGHLKALYIADDDPKHDPFAIEIIATALTAAAEVGEPTLSKLPPEEQREAHKWMDRQLVATTIERCAQVADRFAKYHASELACHPAIRHQIELVAAAIRALKDSK